MLCNNSEVSGTIQYHPPSLVLVTGINTDVALVLHDWFSILIKKLQNSSGAPGLLENPHQIGFFWVWSEPVCDMPGACVCVPCMPSWYIWRMCFISWKDIAGFHRLCTLLHSEWLGTHVPYVHVPSWEWLGTLGHCLHVPSSIRSD